MHSSLNKRLREGGFLLLLALGGYCLLALLSFSAEDPGWAYVGPHVWLGTLWYLLLTLLAVKEVERLPWGRSLVLALLGSAANGLVQFLFIR